MNTETPTVERYSRKMGMDGRAVNVAHFNAWICRCACGTFRATDLAFLSDTNFVHRCIVCSRYFKISQVRGVLNTAHKCGARCLNAKGGDCECACGGAHHGGKS